MNISELITLLNQSQALVERTGNANQSLLEIQNSLLALGNGLLRRDISLDHNADLSSATAQLDSLIASSPGESETNDAQLGQLAAAKSSLVAERDDPQLQTAMELAFSRNADAKTLYEQAHLAYESFSEMESFSEKLQQPTEQELGFLSQYRLQTDRFFLIANYLEVTLNNFVTATWQICDWVSVNWDDPRNKIELFNDNLPFALLPVRVETRFMTVKYVRDNLAYGSVNDVMRDDNQVALAQDVKHAAILKSDASPQRGGTLQTAQVSEIIPDKHELWVRIYPDDIAIHTHENDLTQIEINAGQTYWQEMWSLGTTLPAAPASNPELGPWRVLCSGSGPKRAAWIAKQTTPTNIGSRPAGANVVNPSPVFPTLTVKPASWSQQPCTKVMPDRFVVRVYTNSTTSREVVGSLVPSPLPVGFDPANSYSSYLNQSGSGLNMPPELRWLTEFEEAEKVGMGIRIPLSVGESTSGFQRLLVLGFKQNIDATAGGQLLEELFNNHHYATGLALVPQGTATNNTEEKKSGYAGLEPGQEDSFATERQGDLFAADTSHYLKTDGQRLGEALGMDIATFYNVTSSNTYDVKESMAMSRALWSATLGYYMKNLLTPSVVPADISNTRDFFTNYVHGRGLIPAFRVRNQPYGVLPTTVYSRWGFSDPRSYQGKLHSKILEPLREFWKNNLCGQVLNVDPPYPIPQANPDKLMINILGLNPSSLEFYQRLTAGKFLWSNMVTFMTDIGMTPQQANTLNFAGLDLQLDTLYRGSTVNLNYSGIPRILAMSFADTYRLLNGPVVDTLALSETLPIQKILNSNATINANYIQWLQQSPLSKIRNEDFTNVGAPAGQAPPQALLYLLLRHAWFLEYLEASQCVLTTAQVISVDAWFNQEFIKIAGDVSNTDSVTQEQSEMLYGVVKSEVNYEYGVVIDNTMRNLDTNDEYHTSGMTPEAFEAFIRDRAAPLIEQDATERFNERLKVYNTEESQWQYLTKSYDGIAKGLSMEDYLFEQILSDNPCIQQLNEVSAALGVLKTLPTARLERCLAEHLDTCSYRLDSWLNGLVLERMQEQRDATPNGIYVGAYGIIEKPHPGPFPGIQVVNLSDVPGTSSWSRAIARLGTRDVLAVSPRGGPLVITNGNYITSIAPENQQSTFLYLGDDPGTKLIEDPDSGEVVPEQRENPLNEGFILAPSLNHAVAAAILRAGYVAHRNTGSVGEAMSVTLTSARVRTAMYYLDGIRNGQMLAALLGYRFERGLHDWQITSTTTVPLDGYIYELRGKYPLVANSATPTPANQTNDAQTNHVVDGLQLVQAFGNGLSTSWASGITGLDSGLSGYISAHFTVIRDIVVNVKDDMDAIGDLLLSESIYQVSRGNTVRSGAVLNALGAGDSIPEPEIIKTPRQSDTLMHRCIVQLEPAAVVNGNWNGSSYRAIAEPALNNWLASQLPDPSDILIHVSYMTRTGTSPNYTYTPQDANITMDDLGVQPIDLLSILSTPGSDMQADSSELSRRVVYYVQQNVANHDDKPVDIDYRSRLSMAATQRNIFELMPLINSLIQIAGKSRAAEPEDFMVPGLADGIIATNPNGGLLDTSGILTRLINAIGSANATIGLHKINDELFTPNPLTTNTISRVKSASYTSTDLNDLRDMLMRAANFGIEGAIPEMGVSDTSDVRDMLTKQADLVYTEVNRRFTAANTRITATLPTDPKAIYKELSEIAQIVFNRSFRVFPDITLYNATDLNTSLGYPLMSVAGTYAVEEWMYGVSRVRPRMGEYHKQMLLSESITNRPFTTQRVAQFPMNTQTTGPDCWVAMKLPSAYEMPSDALSLVIETNSTYPATISCGMIIDEWPEQIPLDDVTAGIAVHYDQPSSEAPQSILIATTPVIKNKWVWNDLMDTLCETMDMAAIRAVEPDMIETSALAQVLPALVTQMSGGTDTSPSLDFAKNIIVSPPGMDNPVNFTAFTSNPLNLNNLNPNSN